MAKQLADGHSISQSSLKMIDESLIKLGYEFAGAYRERLSDELWKETRQSLSDFFGEERAAQLRGLKESGSDADKKEFDAIIRKKADQRIKEAMTELADQLKISTPELLLNADAG